MPETPSTGWRIVCDPETLDELRDDARFHVLLSLARVCNTLRFCQLVISEIPAADSPATARQRLNAFLFMAAALYEGVKVARMLRRHFRDESAFVGGLGALLKERDTKDLWSQALSKLRNKIVFHFDVDVPPAALERLDLPSYSFAAGLDRRAGHVYYDLADAVAMNYLLDQLADGRPESEVTRDLLRRTVEVATRFVTAADQLFSAVLPAMGFRLEGSIDVPSESPSFGA